MKNLVQNFHIVFSYLLSRVELLGNFPKIVYYKTNKINISVNFNHITEKYVYLF